MKLFNYIYNRIKYRKIYKKIKNKKRKFIY